VEFGKYQGSIGRWNAIIRQPVTAGVTLHP
jgi:hypothetical protein